MKRKITELEQQLIEFGWKLVAKEYCGKNSEKTQNYVYEKKIGFVEYGIIPFKAKVIIDYKREKIIRFTFENYDCQFIGFKDLLILERRNEILNKELLGIIKLKESENE